MNPIIYNSLKFELYRYQMTPVKRTQLELFGKSITFEELKEKKNEIFSEKVLQRDMIEIFRKGTYIQKKHANKDNLYMFKFASKKQLTHHTKELEDETLEDYPFVYIVVDNNPDNQIIAISRNYKAFNSTDAIANILESEYNSQLKKHDLTFSLTPILDKYEYWSVLENYKDRITQIRFDIIRPNITNLSTILKENVKELASSTNSLKTTIELNSPDSQTLENINKENEQIKALSDYSVEGGGEVSLKVKGVRGRIKTSKSIRTFEIDDILITGNADDIDKIMRNITTL